jgi:hypothetical protein
LKISNRYSSALGSERPPEKLFRAGRRVALVTIYVRDQFMLSLLSETWWSLQIVLSHDLADGQNKGPSNGSLKSTRRTVYK